jgi:PTH1 family peptidyl-tRNA hydrolase
MENLWIIVGLGNPGREYARTRHNAGFLVVDRLAEKWQARWDDARRFKCRLTKVDWHGQKILLCKPQTFMNASGVAVGPLAVYYQAPPERVLAVVDDADLPFGEIRLRAQGSSAGHHGLESIEAHLNSRQFPRLRIGIGRESREIINYVLGSFRKAEMELLARVLKRACEQIECWLEKGIGPAMNRYNGQITLEEEK